MAGKVVLEFPSDYKFLNMVDVVCGEILAGLCCYQDDANEIAISVIEACTNAIEHGNKQNPDQPVRITFDCDEERLTVVVEDRGEGFDYDSFIKHIPDPAALDHLRGRGIYIMRTMMDSCTFESMPGSGIRVTLEKLLRKLPQENVRKE